MPHKAIFLGLVVDENNRPVSTGYVGDEPCYIVNDAGFRRHIPSEQVDRQIFKFMQDQIEGHEDILSEQTAKMLGQDDIFSRAIIQNQLKNMEQQFEHLLEVGIPEDGRAYLGMMGFQVVINIHGEVIEVKQPGTTTTDDDGGE
jgi:hypothetical protein